MKSSAASVDLYIDLVDGKGGGFEFQKEYREVRPNLIVIHFRQSYK